MKKLFILCSLLQITVVAQTKIINDLATFKELEVSNGISINLVKSNENKLEVKGKKAAETITKISNKILRIGLPFSKIPSKNSAFGEVVATLYFKDDIAKITANNKSTVIGKHLKQNNIVCIAKENSIIELSLQVNEVACNASSGGIITLQGTANSQSVIVDLYGIYEGFELKVKGNTSVSAKSGGKAEVYSEKKLIPTVGFGGSIFYKGNPEISEDKKINGGIIQKRS